MIALADPHARTLVDFTLRSHFAAGRGGHGQGKRWHGKNGADVEIRLPVGTAIWNAETRHLVADLVHADQRVTLAKGGRGGRGNARFTTSVRQTPRFSEKGEPAEQFRLRLELKLLADVGVIGLPNVGKSSLIAQVSAARPKIADYPFTTLVPNLGVVRIEEGRNFVIADLPGLVEGASQGAGRGHAFLRHVERTRVMIHVLNVGDADTDPPHDLEVVNRELTLHAAELATRPQFVALNKLDLNPPEEKVAATEAYLAKHGYRSFRISALTGEGCFPLMAQAAQLLDSLPVEVEPAAPPAEAERREEPLQVVRLGERSFQVTGTHVERMVRMTDLKNEDAVRFLHRRLERIGVIRKLRELGAQDDDVVRVGKIELRFVE